MNLNINQCYALNIKELQYTLLRLNFHRFGCNNLYAICVIMRDCQLFVESVLLYKQKIGFYANLMFSMPTRNCVTSTFVFRTTLYQGQHFPLEQLYTATRDSSCMPNLAEKYASFCMNCVHDLDVSCHNLCLNFSQIFFRGLKYLSWFQNFGSIQYNHRHSMHEHQPLT